MLLVRSGGGISVVKPSLSVMPPVGVVSAGTVSGEGLEPLSTAIVVSGVDVSSSRGRVEDERKSCANGPMNEQFVNGLTCNPSLKVCPTLAIGNSGPKIAQKTTRPSQAAAIFPPTEFLSTTVPGSWINDANQNIYDRIKGDIKQCNECNIGLNRHELTSRDRFC